MSSFRLKLPTPELERSIKVKEKLESSLLLKKLLLGLVLFGTAMFISNGVITPAMSGYFLSPFPFYVLHVQVFVTG
jgi:KUP system potassium uptake protein